MEGNQRNLMHDFSTSAVLLGGEKSDTLSLEQSVVIPCILYCFLFY